MDRVSGRAGWEWGIKGRRGRGLDGKGEGEKG